MLLRGATGPSCAFVNGTYVLTAEQLNGKPVYAKEGDNGRWLFFSTTNKWFVTSGRNVIIADKAAGLAFTEAGLAHPAAAKVWQVIVDGNFKIQPVEASTMVRSLRAFAF